MYEHMTHIQATRGGMISQRRGSGRARRISFLREWFIQIRDGDLVPFPTAQRCSLLQSSWTNLLSWHEGMHDLSISYTEVMLCEVPPKKQRSMPWNLQTCLMKDSCRGDTSELKVPKLGSWDQSFMHDKHWHLSKQWDVGGWPYLVSSLQFKTIKWEMKLN